MSIVLVNSYASFPKTVTVASSAVTKNLTVSQNSGFPYTIPIAAAGSTKYGTPPYTWYIVSGTLPAGLTFTESTGIISGSPTTVTALSTVVFGVRDVNGLVADVTQSINFQVFARMTATATSTTTQTLTVTEPNYPNFNTFTAASGGVTPYEYYVVSGTLPAGLTLTGATSVVSGKPTAVQAATNVTFGVRDVNLVTATTTVTVSFTVVAAPTATLNQTAQNLTVGQTGYSFAPLTSVTGGVSPYTYSITSGTLPSTLSQSTTTGTVTGSVTAASSSTVVFKVVDSNGVAAPTASVPYSAVTFSASTDNTAKNFQTGTAISAYAPIIGAGGVTPYNYSISSGTLPTGLSYGSGSGGSGDVTGTPTAVTTSTVSFKVKDANGIDSGLTATETFTITAPVTGSIVFRTNLFGSGTSNTFTWTVPTGVTSISVVCIGGGGGKGDGGDNSTGGAGAGGGLVFINNIAVTPGQVWYVGVGRGGADGYSAGRGGPGGIGGDSYFGPTNDATAKTWMLAHGGGGGGSDFNTQNFPTIGGGGGAAGYAGAGGNGGGPTVTTATGSTGGTTVITGATSAGYTATRFGGGNGAGYNAGASAYQPTIAPTIVSGSGGGGGGSGGSFTVFGQKSGFGGGGTGLFGSTTTDSSGTTTAVAGATTAGTQGSFAHNGGSGAVATGVGKTSPYGGGDPGAQDGAYPTQAPGGDYGGGGSGIGSQGDGGHGGSGAVRIVWPGNTRQFPSTNVNTV